MKNILITGGLGYIGSHTSILLIENGFNLYIIDSLYNSELRTLNSIKEIVGKEFINKNIIFFNGDIRDFKFLDYVFRTARNNGHNFDGVIHFAGLKSVKESFYKPFLYWDVNVEGTRNLIRVMDKFKCFNLIFSSSATVYGNVSNPPIKENCKVNPNNFYGFTKSKAENLIEKFYLKNKQKCRVIILRYFNPIGNNDSGMIGERSNADTHNLFPLLCNAAIHNKKDFKVFGNDWDTRDGTPIRDYVHVLDIAEGHISALRYLHGSSPSLFKINLGSGIGLTVLEMINLFEKFIGIKIPYTFGNRRIGDVAVTLADIELSKRILKWSPKRPVKDMFLSGWKWHQTQETNFF